jgi:hypothetical protein
MGNRDPRNGPSLSKATYKASRPGSVPSPERSQAERAQAASDAAKQRYFWQTLHNDPDMWFEEHFKKWATSHRGPNALQAHSGGAAGKFD